jgi:hypothetical protein
MNKIIEGKIEEKYPYSGGSDKGPAGDIMVNGVKLTCWSKSLFEEFTEGETFKIEYSEKESVYNGKEYVNRSVIGLINKSKVESVISELSPETQAKIKSIGEQMDNIKKEDKTLTPLQVAERLVMPTLIKGESMIELGNRKFLITLMEIK